MARLIPSFIDDHTPPGERDVFNMLSGGPDDWTAIHSLDLAPWNRGLRTEIDFLIIVPDTGLLCVEVKSQKTISFANDRWNPPEIKRSPFKQVVDGQFTFYRRLRELAPQFRAIPVVHCCIFPNARFDLQPNLSIQPWELVDSRIFRSFARSEDFCRDLRARMISSIGADENLRPLTRCLSATQIERIVGLCFPVQKLRSDNREEIERRELESERLLRDQQKPVLRLVESNDRVIIKGPAGTGKTLIAMEVARRAAEKGKRVGLVCFNQLVGDWMHWQMEHSSPILPNIIAGRAIRIMAEMAGVVIPKDPSAKYWESDLPEELEERLTDPDLRAASSFDYLVVDEAQDLIARPVLWECLIRFLDGGLDNGSFCLLGDFDTQVLSERSILKQSLASIQNVSKPSLYLLSENCRNYRIVGDSAVRLSGFSHPVYSGYMRTGGGIQNYDIFFYEEESEQLVKLTEWLKDFKSKGYRASEITILSFRNPENSAAARLASAGFNLSPAWQRSGNSVSYTSVHAFKGLENKVVIITDVILGVADFDRHLFYTGMTRAREFVRISCDKSSEDTLTGWLTGEAT
jgi:UvrD-like helicase C-terminal domain/Nuclease-related domain/PhoH-like protein